MALNVLLLLLIPLESSIKGLFQLITVLYSPEKPHLIVVFLPRLELIKVQAAFT